MSFRAKLLVWWRLWFGNRYSKVMRILRHRYADELQHAARFSQHAQKMQYPHFRDALLRIAADETRHAGWIAEKIRALEGQLPDVVEAPLVEENSWQYLLTDLEEERRCGADLEEEILSVQDDHPDIAELLQHIDEEERKHRDEIRGMLMRSDPQALWPGLTVK